MRKNENEKISKDKKNSQIFKNIDKITFYLNEFFNGLASKIIVFLAAIIIIYSFLYSEFISFSFDDKFDTNVIVISSKVGLNNVDKEKNLLAIKEN